MLQIMAPLGQMNPATLDFGVLIFSLELIIDKQKNAFRVNRILVKHFLV